MRMETSLEALKKLQDIGKVFLTGEYWDGGDETWTAVLDLGYGLLYEKWKWSSSPCEQVEDIISECYLTAQT